MWCDPRTLHQQFSRSRLFQHFSQYHCTLFIHSTLQFDPLLQKSTGNFKLQRPGCRRRWTGIFLRLTFFLPHSNHSVFRIHCSGAPVFLSRSLLQTVATGLRNQIVAVPYAGNEPRPRFPRRSVLRVVKVCARGSKTATIVFGHFSDQRGRNAKRWNENSSDRNRCTNHTNRNCYSRMQSTRDIKTCSTSACHLRVICRLSVADRGLRQSFHNGTPWLPWSPFTL